MVFNKKNIKLLIGLFVVFVLCVSASTLTTHWVLGDSTASLQFNGSTVFSPLKHGKMGENVHFETDGMGLKHYFYRTDNILIWWQVEPDKAETTYNDLIKFDFADLKIK